MASGFWEKLNRPFFVLAPMANVTDAAFRSIIAKYGKPDVLWTEFVSCDGICSPGRENLLVDFKYSEAERPIVAQVFSANPENVYKTAVLVRELGFDGLDINMGCPDKNVVKQGAGAALIRTPELAQEIIRAAQRGMGGLPVSVKTRVGDRTNELDRWLPQILETEPSAVTVHARTRKELSLVPARWELVREAVSIRDRLGSHTLIIGNGDIHSEEAGKKLAEESGADGIMVGRGIFGNPWFFTGKPLPPIEDRLRVMVEHTKLFEEMFGEEKNFDVMKKHFKAYVSGFDGAKELRVACMAAKDAKGVEETVESWISSPASVRERGGSSRSGTTSWIRRLRELLPRL